MAQTAEEVEAQFRAPLDEARQEGRKYLDNRLKQRDNLIKQELQQQRDHMQQLLKDGLKNQMNQMIFQMQQMFAVERAFPGMPQNLTNPPPPPGS